MRPLNYLLAALLGGLGIAPVAALADDCQVAFAQPVLDFGRFNRTTLQVQAGGPSLGTRSVDLTVSCPVAQPMPLLFRAVAADANRFRFGEQGSFALRLEDALLDGQPVELGSSSAGGQTPTRGARQLGWAPGHYLTPLRAGVPVEGQVLRARLQVQAWGGDSLFRLNDAQSWQTDGRLELGSSGRDLQLRATFAPVACVPRLGNGGTVDFGRISAQQLSEQGGQWRRSLSLNVQCDAPARFAISVRDNRPDNVREFPGLLQQGALFGTARTRNGQALGAYSVTLAAGTVGDGAPVRALQAASDGQVWQAPAGPVLVYPDRRLLGFTGASQDDAGPAPLSQLTGILDIDLYLAPASVLTLDEEVPLNGAATLEIVYL